MGTTEQSPIYPRPSHPTRKVPQSKFPTSKKGTPREAFSVNWKRACSRKIVRPIVPRAPLARFTPRSKQKVAQSAGTGERLAFPAVASLRDETRRARHNLLSCVFIIFRASPTDFSSGSPRCTSDHLYACNDAHVARGALAESKPRAFVHVGRHQTELRSRRG